MSERQLVYFVHNLVYADYTTIKLEEEETRTRDRMGKSRFTVVRMENNPVINK